MMRHTLVWEAEQCERRAERALGFALKMDARGDGAAVERWLAHAGRNELDARELRRQAAAL